MPLYHFNVHCGDMRRESEGYEFLNLETAKREAVRLSGDMIRELGPEFWEGDGWALEVTDEGGAILFTLVFFASLAPSTPTRLSQSSPR